MTQDIVAVVGGVTRHASYFTSPDSHAIVFHGNSLPKDIADQFLEKVREIEHIHNPAPIIITRELPGCLYLKLPPT